jgi:hypothetical protein
MTLMATTSMGIVVGVIKRGFAFNGVVEANAVRNEACGSEFEFWMAD